MHLPSCNSPVRATTGSRGTVLEHGLKDGISASRLDRVEEEDGLANVASRSGRDGPSGSEGADWAGTYIY